MVYRTSLIAACMAAAISLAACGSGTRTQTAKSAGTATSAQSDSTASSPVGSPIVVGTICSCSGPQASLLADVGKSANTWADAVNATGGINGHPVRMIVKDDGQNPATGLQDAKELVQTDHVMAIVGEVSLVDQAWAGYVATQGVPVVGGVTPEAPFLTNPDFFPSGAQLVMLIDGTWALAKRSGKHTIGTLYCAESPICAQIVPLGKGLAALNGLKFASESISATAPSYAAPCLSIKSAGADALYVADNATIVSRVAAGCAQQGYNPTEVNTISSGTNAWLADPQMNGALLAGTNANPYDASTPAVQQFQAALSKYAPGVLHTAQFSNDDIYPWTGGRLFQAAAAAAHLGPNSTPADVKKGLYALHNETLDGLAPPLNFTPSKPAFIPCYYTIAIKNHQFTSLNDDRPTCLTAAQAKVLAQSLG